MVARWFYKTFRKHQLEDKQQKDDSNVYVLFVFLVLTIFIAAVVWWGGKGLCLFFNHSISICR